ncbi:TetR/AcrR family transcriptional regulator [Desulfarculus baarsii]
MKNPLETARKDPESMKARILAKARTVFGDYGFHGATMRIIAQEVGIDVSTLYYHWGDKGDLYEAVILDITEDLRQELARVEKVIKGRPLAQRIEIALDMMTNYLFDHPEVSNLNVMRFFAKTRHEMTWDARIPVFAVDIARSMGMQQADGSVSTDTKMEVMAIMMAIHNFIAGEDFFRSMLAMDRPAYVTSVKRTLKFLMIPAFAGVGLESQPGTHG